MEETVYEFFAASIQNGYIGNLIDIVESAGGARSLYEMSPEKMESRLHFSAKLIRHIMSKKEGIDIEGEYHKMLENGICYVNYRNGDFPKRLLNIASCPYGLFYKGSLPGDNEKSVAIIGARECTEYGRLMAEYFGDRLARNKVNVVSGMAWGIDGISQMAAVQAGGKSFGVLGCGVDIIYPRKNHRLYDMLCNCDNGIISEYAPGTLAKSSNFPPRNRIISGMADVVIVVEARAKSGTLITVDMAIEQGKSIMIVPGRITDPLSVGCLNLLKDGAGVAVNVDSVMEELSCKESKILPDTKRKNRRDYVPIKEKSDRLIALTGEEAAIIKHIGMNPLSVEDISDKTKMSAGEVLVTLTMLEMKGLVRDVGVMQFVKNTSYT